MSRHCLDIDWDIRHWNIFLNIFWIYLKKDEKKEEKSGSAGDRTHGGGRVPLCCLTLYRLRHRTYTFEKSKNTSYKLCTQCCMLHSMSFVVLFVECWMLYINVATYVETLDSLVSNRHSFSYLHSPSYFFWSAVFCATLRQTSAQKNYV